MVDPKERDTLVAFANSSGFDKWIHTANWFEGDPCLQNWFGVSCDATNTSIQNLYGETGGGMLIMSRELSGNGLVGTLGSSIQNLSSLVRLVISWNSFLGTVQAVSFIILSKECIII
eukprot:TRINITY_DN9895_c0_g2_i6.p1 TRINITY_DN9895_c0_g2~~TRINITY_DN9895_c0_g2_i6.p1  ORF type:complete len:117 (-),score=30.05 TRINITY_DN9895_c0_g2_i6:197-547(-)